MEIKNILIDKNSFINTFTNKVYEKIVKESIVEEKPVKNFKEFKNLMGNLYDELSENNYSPTNPLKYVFLHLNVQSKCNTKNLKKR